MAIQAPTKSDAGLLGRWLNDQIHGNQCRGTKSASPNYRHNRRVWGKTETVGDVRKTPWIYDLGLFFADDRTCEFDIHVLRSVGSYLHVPT